MKKRLRVLGGDDGYESGVRARVGAGRDPVQSTLKPKSYDDGLRVPAVVYVHERVGQRRCS